MPKAKPLVIGVLALYLSFGVSAQTPFKFDLFSHLSCKDELVRVDNYAAYLAKLKDLPEDVLAVIVIYAGRDDTQRGEVNAHLFGIRDRLLKKKSIDVSRIILLDGGFREKQEIELWIISSYGRDSFHYLACPTIKPEEGLKKSVFTKEIYSCSQRQ